MISKGKLAQIHIAKAQLGLTDEDYRAILARKAGVSSAKELTNKTVGGVMHEFRRLGFQPKPTQKAGRKAPNPPATRQAEMKKVEALLAEAGRAWAYADGMAKHMFKVDRVDFLDDNQLHKLLQALIIDAKRQGRYPDDLA
ncbi:gp16 family protein [Vreelandella titanicae]|jgi:phage gp16-like protein|uniref:gp16 family protein n=1 Tax=Vreelandella titanicae TaxID=664683 RepID=UPI001594E476|nr:regulatory protein GemA [Halomonas titanicae]NVE91567.1 regulatory protein GemA [Halomonas titanicae]|tara:strand:+ start:2597 stop:3019 length:423 start_codon:yes stop_codon:yes gene_type:complete